MVFEFKLNCPACCLRCRSSVQIFTACAGSMALSICQSSKASWARFQRAFEKLAKDSETVERYKGLDRPAKIRFREAWAADPTWNFVTTFKSSAKVKTDTASSTNKYKTAKQLCIMLGKKKARTCFQCDVFFIFVLVLQRVFRM